MKEVSKRNKLSIVINAIGALLAIFSFFTVLDFYIYITIGIFTAIATILNIIVMIVNKKNKETITGDIIAVIGIVIYLFAGPIMGLVCGILLIFSILFKVMYSS